MSVAIIFTSGLFAGVFVKPAISNIVNSAASIIRNRKNSPQLLIDKQRAKDHRMLLSIAKEADQLSPSLASELRNMSGRNSNCL
jgi:hypothetical protein